MHDLYTLERSLHSEKRPYKATHIIVEHFLLAFTIRRSFPVDDLVALLEEHPPLRVGDVGAEPGRLQVSCVDGAPAEGDEGVGVPLGTGGEGRDGPGPDGLAVLAADLQCPGTNLKKRGDANCVFDLREYFSAARCST